MTLVTLPHRPVAGDPEDVGQIIADFDAILAVLNGDVRNDNIAAAAAILVSKLAGGATGDILETAGGVPVWRKVAQARGTRVAAQALGNATFTAITLTAEEYDNDTMLDVGGGTPSRIVPHTAGKYLVTGGGSFAVNANLVRYISLRKNAATNYGEQEVPAVPGGFDQVKLGASEIITFNGTTDYVELVAYQNTGGNLDFTGAWLSVMRLSA